MNLQIVTHPLALHLLSQLRDYETSPDQFRTLTRRLTTLLVLDATQRIALTTTNVATPIKQTQGFTLGQGLAAIPILRAGLGMLDAVLDLFPDVSVGYIGLERQEATAVATSYYCKLPPLEAKFVVCLDPMLATGGSACQAIDLIKQAGALQVVMVNIVAAPEGVEKLTGCHPDVQIFTASLDEGLNQQKYIVPGLGDFGDRLFGTL